MAKSFCGAPEYSNFGRIESVIVEVGLLDGNGNVNQVVQELLDDQHLDTNRDDVDSLKEFQQY